MNEDIRINILLVDDRSENLVALEALLESPYVKLTKCLSGEDALRCVMKEEYAVILMDVQMPGMDGYETAKLIKSREKSKDTPIIFVTAINKEPEHVFEGYDIGAIDYIFKPFDPDILKSKVDQLIKIFANAKEIKLQAALLQEKTIILEKTNQELFRVTCELQKSEALHRVIGETSSDTIIIIDSDRKIISVNPTVESMFGYSMNEMFGQHAEMLLPNDLLNLNQIETTVKAKDGSFFPVELQVKTCVLENNLIYVCTVRDITDRIQQFTKLQHMANHDPLTNLPNRTRLFDMIDKLIKDDCKEFSLLLMDLDHFKSINDTLGHHLGDLLLIRLGALIKELLPWNETVFRLGGDEFAILIPNCDAASGISTAKTILSRIEQPICIDEVTLSVGASMGLVSYPEHGPDIQTLLRRADVAMYTAKKDGSGYAIYSMEQDQNDPHRLQLMGDLRAALDKEELHLVYQPKAFLKNKQVLSVEALLRWNHPKYGQIPPSEFIPLAEQLGVIHSITTWVLTEAIKQSKKWRLADIDIEIAVNLSVRNLQDAELPSRLKDLLHQYDVSPDKITLEITESFIMADPDRAKEVLMKIHQMGIKLSIDDFGTGYSSLAYLKTLPVNTIKIDKSFIADMANDEVDSMIVRSIIYLAHNLGLLVIAEGVEDEKSWDLLTSYGCDIAQGYYLQKPLSEERLTGWLQNRAGVSGGQSV
jgi:diguanylate cyclase (GGDEF)-like protein/PAS domain S-box-containing protein